MRSAIKAEHNCIKKKLEFFLFIKNTKHCRYYIIDYFFYLIPDIKDFFFYYIFQNSTRGTLFPFIVDDYTNNIFFIFSECNKDYR